MAEAETIGVSRREQPFFWSFLDILDQGERILSENLALDEFLTEEYLPYARTTIKSWKTTGIVFRRYVSPTFGARSLCDIKRMEVRSWQNNMIKDGFSTDSVNRAFVALSALVRELKQSDNIAAKAILLLILTDARKSEIIRAKWSDVDWEAKKLRSPRDIPGQQRYIDLNDEACAILKDMQASSKSEWMFAGRKADKPISENFPFWDRVR